LTIINKLKKFSGTENLLLSPKKMAIRGEIKPYFPGDNLLHIFFALRMGRTG